MAVSATYWAAEKDTSRLLKSLDQRIDAWYDYVTQSNLLSLWKLAHQASYAGLRAGGQIGRAGENLEYSTLRVNQYANLKQHILTMVTGQKQYFEAKASNADYKSQAQTIIATSLMEVVMREKDLEWISQQVADFAITYGEGFLFKEWDFKAGDVVAESLDGKPDHSGDVRYHALHGLDLIRDPLRNSPSKHDWNIVRTRANRYDILADYGDSEADKEAILAAPSVKENEEKRPNLVAVGTLASEAESDEIWVYTFFHRKCSAIPNGRQVVFISSDMALSDDDMLYPEMPIYRMAPGEVTGTTLGYTACIDLMPLQQALNAIVSTVVTNLSSYGVQNIWAPEGVKLTIEEIKGGGKLIQGGQTKPESIDFVSIKPEVLKFMELLERWLETLSGVNSVARGNPEASLKSGSALALVQSQAIQFVALIQKSYMRFLEDVGTGTIKDFQKFADEPFLLTITGKDKTSRIKEFTKSDLSEISRIQIQIGNPLSGTIAGRVNMVEQMGNLGLIRTPEMYHSVVTTGRIEPATEGAQADMLLIKAENEALSEGRDVQAVAFEDHPTHMKEHLVVIASPAARAEPNVLKAALAHIAQHHKWWRMVPPDLLMVLGIKPPQPMQPSEGPGIGGQQSQNGKGGGPLGQDLFNMIQKQSNLGPDSGAVPPGQPPGQPPAGMDMPTQPNMPRNPLTGQRAPPPSNGM